LFIFVVLKGDGGVAPQRIQTQFWPDSPQKSAGNSRYVAMSQIRRMLNPFEGIIHTQEHNIFLDYNEDHFSDFHYFMSVVHANSHGDLSQMERALQLYDNGSLCEDINESWMDNIRENIRSKAKRLADNLSQSYQASDQWRKLGKLGQQVLRWDYLDDDGFHWAIMGLLNSHREAKAKSIYDTYTQYYLEVLDHPFEFSFKEIQFKYAKKV
jgi:two-component SAPR family response regulator